MLFPKNRLNDIETKVELDEIEHLIDVTKKNNF